VSCKVIIADPTRLIDRASLLILAKSPELIIADPSRARASRYQKKSQGSVPVGGKPDALPWNTEHGRRYQSHTVFERAPAPLSIGELIRKGQAPRCLSDSCPFQCGFVLGLEVVIILVFTASVVPPGTRQLFREQRGLDAKSDQLTDR